MKIRGLLIVVAVLSILSPLPDAALAQPIDCDNCFLCPNPDEVDTSDFAPGVPVLTINMICEVWECSDFIGCPPDEDAEEAELLAALSNGNPLALKAFASSHKKSIVVIPEREIIVYIGGCNDSSVRVLPLRESQLKVLLIPA